MIRDYVKFLADRISIEVNGKDYIVEWFYGIRLDPATIPEGKHLYKTRNAEDDWGRPISITKDDVLVNFCGSVVTTEDLGITEETDITDVNFDPELDDDDDTEKSTIGVHEHELRINPAGEEEVIRVRLSKEKTPIAFENKVQELMEECDMAREEAEKLTAETEFFLELYYQIGQGLFAVETEYVEHGDLCSPYNGKEYKDWDE